MSTATFGRVSVTRALQLRVASLLVAYHTQTKTFELQRERLRAARWWFLAGGFALGVAARGLAAWIGGM